MRAGRRLARARNPVLRYETASYSKHSVHDGDARDLQAQLAQARSPEEYVDMLQHGVEHFPRVALFWRLSPSTTRDARS